MKETVDEVVKRFHAQMDHVPLLSLYDCDKEVALKSSKGIFHNIILTTHALCRVHLLTVYPLFSCHTMGDFPY